MAVNNVLAMMMMTMCPKMKQNVRNYLWVKKEAPWTSDTSDEVGDFRMSNVRATAGVKLHHFDTGITPGGIEDVALVGS